MKLIRSIYNDYINPALIDYFSGSYANACLYHAAEDGASGYGWGDNIAEDYL